MEDRETPRIRNYGESKTTRIMMETVPHVTSGSGLRKFHSDGIFVRQSVQVTVLLFREYCKFLGAFQSELRLLPCSCASVCPHWTARVLPDWRVLKFVSTFRYRVNREKRRTDTVCELRPKKQLTILKHLAFCEGSTRNNAAWESPEKRLTIGLYPTQKIK